MGGGVGRGEGGGGCSSGLAYLGFRAGILAYCLCFVGVWHFELFSLVPHWGARGIRGNSGGFIRVHRACRVWGP